jgi:hypothetical protein
LKLVQLERGVVHERLHGDGRGAIGCHGLQANLAVD